MTKHSALLATTAGAALVVVVCATWIGRGAGRAAADLVARDERLAAELRELTRSQERTAAALERLERLLAARLEAPAGERRALDPNAGPGPKDLAALVASLDALRAGIEEESRRTREAIQGAPALGGESLLDVKRRKATPDWLALDELGERWRADERLASRTQYLQTARDLLGAYGPPSAIYRPSGGGVLFVYRRHAEGEAGPAWFFRVQDGMVIEFFLEDEQPAEGER
jgi:hypothetical protein